MAAKLDIFFIFDKLKSFSNFSRGPMQNRVFPIVWIIGATRSCKSALAKALTDDGPASLGFGLIATGDYFREQHAQPDTLSREFVFNISATASKCLSKDPSCHVQNIEEKLEREPRAYVIEGERNPNEFARLYDPKKDMVFFVHRQDVPIYKTEIERGIKTIEDIVRWNVGNGIAPENSVFSATYGNGRFTAERFTMHFNRDKIIAAGAIAGKKKTGLPLQRYPWIHILIGMVREKIMDYYNIKNPAKPALSEPQL